MVTTYITDVDRELNKHVGRNTIRTCFSRDIHDLDRLQPSDSFLFGKYFLFYIYIDLADAFIQSDLQLRNTISDTL